MIDGKDLGWEIKHGYCSLLLGFYLQSLTKKLLSLCNILNIDT